MRTIIFATAIRLLTPLFLVFSVYILLRGHNHPGGGFIGGLIGSIAFVFYTLAHGHEQTAKSYFRMSWYERVGRRNYIWRFVYRRLLRREFSAEPAQPLPHLRKYYILRLRPAALMGAGLFLSATSGLLGPLHGKPFMSAWWLDAKIPIIGSVGSPLMFDTGVYLLVLGMVLKMVFTMAKE